MNVNSAGKAQFEGYGRNRGIDLLRGLSILLVIVTHVRIRIPLTQTALAAVAPGWLLDEIGDKGYEGVFIFFVISGFLIATNSLRRWGSLDRISLRGFYARRFARIAPCLLLLVFVLSLLDLVGAHGYTITHSDQSLPGAIFAALGLHINVYEGNTGYLPAGWDVLWSLSIEEAFYLGFPVVCLLTRRLWVLVPILVALALSLPLTRHWAAAGGSVWMQKAYLPGMAAIATGIIGALITEHFRPPRRWVNGALLGLGAAGIAAILLAENFVWRLLGGASMLLLTISAGCLVVAMQWGYLAGRQRRWRGIGWLRSFGFHSYEIYLTHAFVVLGVVAVFRAVSAGMTLGWLWYLPAIALSWGLGAAVARGFSIPCDRALRNFLLRRAPRRVNGQSRVPGGMAVSDGTDAGPASILGLSED